MFPVWFPFSVCVSLVDDVQRHSCHRKESFLLVSMMIITGMGLSDEVINEFQDEYGAQSSPSLRFAQYGIVCIDQMSAWLLFSYHV